MSNLACLNRWDTLYHPAKERIRFGSSSHWKRCCCLFFTLFQGSISSTLWSKVQMRWSTELGTKDAVLFQQQNCAQFYQFKELFLNIFFGVTCPFWLSLLFSFFFCHQVIHLIHLVFRWTWESNPHPTTMAQTVSPWCSPLDQGASPSSKNFKLYPTFMRHTLRCMPVRSVYIYWHKSCLWNVGEIDTSSLWFK